MAASEYPIDSILWAQQYIKNMPLYRVQQEVVNDAAKYFWRAAPWAWTLGDLPTQIISNNVGDYVVTLPADFEYALSVELTLADKLPKGLEVVSYLHAYDTRQGQPTQISVTGEGVAGLYRLEPTPIGYTGTLPTISGIYKKAFTKLTETTIYTSGALIFPDMYIDVFRACVLYYAYLYADDQRAGNTQFSNGQMTYTGQRATMESMIEDLKKRVPLPLEDVQTGVNPKKEK